MSINEEEPIIRMSVKGISSLQTDQEIQLTAHGDLWR